MCYSFKACALLIVKSSTGVLTEVSSLQQNRQHRRQDCTTSIALQVLHQKYYIATIAKVLYHNYCIASIVSQQGGKLSALV